MTWIAAGGAAIAASLVFAAPATADVVVRTDRNDSRGPLDIRSVAHGHAGPQAVAHTITTFEPFSAQTLRSGGGFTLQFDTRGTPRTWERFVFVGSGGGAINAVVADQSRVIGRARVTRPNARSVRVVVPKRFLRNGSGVYGWIALSYYDGGPCPSTCFDLVRGNPAILHDIVPPRIMSFSVPRVTSGTSTVAESFDAYLRTTKDARWRIQRRDVGEAEWTTVKSGTSRDTTNRRVTLTGTAEGDAFDLRVLATDPAGKAVGPIRRTAVPYDDRNLIFTWDANWGPAGGGLPFKGTLTQSNGGAATFTHDFTGTYVAWVAPGGGGTATVTVDGTATQVDLGAFVGDRKLVFEAEGLADGNHTIVIERVTGVLVVDAIALY